MGATRSPRGTSEWNLLNVVLAASLSNAGVLGDVRQKMVSNIVPCRMEVVECGVSRKSKYHMCGWWRTLKDGCEHRAM